jgi:molybdopterin biosynthesis enzyme MoaB
MTEILRVIIVREMPGYVLMMKSLDVGTFKVICSRDFMVVYNGLD